MKKPSSLANSSTSNPPGDASPKSSSVEPQKVKMVLLGDPQVGKSSMVISYTTHRAFQQQNLGSSDNKQGSKLKAPFADYYTTATVDDKDFELSMWDTNASTEYEHIRPLNFAKTDIFLLCFSVTQETSLDNVTAKWIREINNCPAGKSAPLKLLVGLQTDMRDEQWSAYDKGKRITKEQAMQVATEIGAVDYVECSARTAEGVEDVFLAALNAVIYPQLLDNKKLLAGGEKINLRGSGGANMEEDSKDALDATNNNAGGGGHHKKKRCIIC